VCFQKLVWPFCSMSRMTHMHHICVNYIYPIRQSRGYINPLSPFPLK
jgi:hypothetical protein